MTSQPEMLELCKPPADDPVMESRLCTEVSRQALESHGKSIAETLNLDETSTKIISYDKEGLVESHSTSQLINNESTDSGMFTEESSWLDNLYEKTTAQVTDIDTNSVGTMSHITEDKQPDRLLTDTASVSAQSNANMTTANVPFNNTESCGAVEKPSQLYSGAEKTPEALYKSDEENADNGKDIETDSPDLSSSGNSHVPLKELVIKLEPCDIEIAGYYSGPPKIKPPRTLKKHKIVERTSISLKRCFDSSALLCCQVSDCKFRTPRQGVLDMHMRKHSKSRLDELKSRQSRGVFPTPEIEHAPPCQETQVLSNSEVMICNIDMSPDAGDNDTAVYGSVMLSESAKINKSTKQSAPKNNKAAKKRTKQVKKNTNAISESALRNITPPVIARHSINSQPGPRETPDMDSDPQKCEYAEISQNAENESKGSKRADNSIVFEDDYESSDYDDFADNDDEWQNLDERSTDSDYTLSDEEEWDAEPKKKVYKYKHKRVSELTEKERAKRFRLRTCDVEGCTFQCNTYTRFKNHRNKHKGITYACEVEGCSFVTHRNPGALRTHKLRIHGTQERHILCDECGSSFRFANDLYSHKRYVHRSLGMIKTYPCDQCHYVCRDAHHLRRHILIHTKDKPWKCTECSYSSNQKTNLNTHMRIHTGEKPFKCEHCDFSASHNVTLKGHIKTKHPTL